MMKSKIVATLLVSSLLSGCAFKGQLHDVAINHNKLLADTANELTLLNIVRAKHRQPLHFTRMTEMRGNASLSVTTGASFTLPEIGVSRTIDNAGERSLTTSDGKHSSSPSISTTAATNPQFVVAPLDNEKFQRGIMQPITPTLYHYFLEQGWPEDLLAALFIERMDFSAKKTGKFIDDKSRTIGISKGKVFTSIKNNPSDYKYSSILDTYDMSMVFEDRDPKVISSGAVLARSSVDDLAILDGSKFDVDKAGNIVRIKSPSAKIQFSMEATMLDNIGQWKTENSEKKETEIDKEKIPKIRYFCIANDTIIPPKYKVKTADANAADKFVEGVYQEALLIYILKNIDLGISESGSIDIDDGSTRSNDSKGAEGESKICFARAHKRYIEVDGVSLSLRSPDGIFYFLGESIRKGVKPYTIGKANPKAVGDTDPDVYYRVIEVLTQKDAIEPLVTTTFNGERHFISGSATDPESTGNRSTQTLGLVQQLLNLHKSSENLPRSTSVVIQ